MTRKEQKEERRQAILMTALTLFVERGYYDTKIADIAAAVPMSTGLLFHYFGSKIELYAFLYDYATRFVTLELSQNVDKTDNNYFGLYRQILTAKVDSMAKYPCIYLFLNRADGEDYGEAVMKIDERREKYNRIMEALRERADITVFPPNISYSMTWDMLDYTVNGLMENSIKGENFRADLFLEEALEYVDMVKQMVLS